MEHSDIASTGGSTTAPSRSTTIEPNSAASKQAWQTDCSVDQSDCVDHVDLAGFSGFV